MWIIGAIIVILLFIKLLYDNGLIFNNNDVQMENKDFKGNINSSLLTDNELNFYNKLKQLTDKFDLLLFSKVRLADIFKSDDYSSFNKIRSKHIDFIITDKNTKPIFFIELDDSTHNKKSNYKRDIEKNEIFEKTNNCIFRVKIDEINSKLSELEKMLIVLNK